MANDSQSQLLNDLSKVETKLQTSSFTLFNLNCLLSQPIDAVTDLAYKLSTIAGLMPALRNLISLNHSAVDLTEQQIETLTFHLKASELIFTCVDAAVGEADKCVSPFQPLEVPQQWPYSFFSSSGLTAARNVATVFLRDMIIVISRVKVDYLDQFGYLTDEQVFECLRLQRACDSPHIDALFTPKAITSSAAYKAHIAHHNTSSALSNVFPEQHLPHYSTSSPRPNMADGTRPQDPANISSVADAPFVTPNSTRESTPVAAMSRLDVNQDNDKEEYNPNGSSTATPAGPETSDRATESSKTDPAASKNQVSAEPKKAPWDSPLPFNPTLLSTLVPPSHLEAYILKPHFSESSGSTTWTFTADRLPLPFVEISKHLRTLPSNYSLMDSVGKLPHEQFRCMLNAATERKGDVISVAKLSEMTVTTLAGEFGIETLIFVLRTDIPFYEAKEEVSDPRMSAEGADARSFRNAATGDAQKVQQNASAQTDSAPDLPAQTPHIDLQHFSAQHLENPYIAIDGKPFGAAGPFDEFVKNLRASSDPCKYVDAYVPNVLQHYQTSNAPYPKYSFEEQRAMDKWENKGYHPPSNDNTNFVKNANSKFNLFGIRPLGVMFQNNTSQGPSLFSSSQPTGFGQANAGTSFREPRNLYSDFAAAHRSFGRGPGGYPASGPPPPNIFGPTNPTTSSSHPFANNNTQQGGLFGGPGSSLFSGSGGQPQTTQQGGLFGQRATSIFETLPRPSETAQPAQQGGLFGRPTTQTAHQGNLFGGTDQATQHGGLFGGTTHTTQQGGLFGGATQNTQSGGLFSRPATQTTQHGLFGRPTTQTTQQGGLFGGTSQTTQHGSLFGGTPQQPQQSGGLFGNATSNNTPGTTPQGQNQGSPFGTAQSTFNNKPAYGQSVLFGTASSTANNASGSTANPKPLFGQPTSPFGTSTPPANNASETVGIRKASHVFGVPTPISSFTTPPGMVPGVKTPPSADGKSAGKLFGESSARPFGSSGQTTEPSGGAPATTTTKATGIFGPPGSFGKTPSTSGPQPSTFGNTTGTSGNQPSTFGTSTLTFSKYTGTSGFATGSNFPSTWSNPTSTSKKPAIPNASAPLSGSVPKTTSTTTATAADTNQASDKANTTLNEGAAAHQNISSPTPVRPNHTQGSPEELVSAVEALLNRVRVDDLQNVGANERAEDADESAVEDLLPEEDDADL